MLKMRLQRVGRTHEPSFRLVLTDSKNSTKSGRFKEILGSYDPRKSTEVLKADRIKYWLSQGVTPTTTVNNLLITHKIITGEKLNASSVSKTEQKAKLEAKAKSKAEAVAAEVPKEEVAQAPAESVIVEEAPAPAEAPVENAE